MHITTRMLMTLAAAAILAGCGGSGTRSTSATDGDSGAGGKIEHVDGTLALADDRVAVTPHGGDAVTLNRDPALPENSVRAASASGERMRVFYRGDTAIRMEPAPVVDTAARTLVGIVTATSATSITITDEAGTETTLKIRPADQAAFDQAHLREHQKTQKPITVYYEQKGATKLGLAYEDA